MKSHIPLSVSARTQRSLINSNDISLIKARTENFLKSYFPDTIRLWNNLNIDIKIAPSVEAFKNKLNKDVKSPPNYFSMGSRKINIIMAKLRMNCSNLNSHLFRIKVVVNSNCKCGYHDETVFHYLFECPLYTGIRGIMD